MNIEHIDDRDFEGPEPPSADIFAGEYVLGVLDATQRREAQARIEQDPGFARLVADWERRLAPLLAEFGGAEIPPHLWPRIRSQLGWPAVGDGSASAAPPKASLWQNPGFWRGMTGLAAAAALAAVAIGPLGLLGPADAPDTRVVVQPPTPPTPPVEDPDAPKPVSTLLRDDGSTGWLASVDPRDGTVLMVPVPGPADAQGREPELWLIPPGGKAQSLGIVSIDRSHTVKVPDTLRDALDSGAILAITLEPKGGAPQGVATGPIIAKGDIVVL
ncbi:MAG: anti-sigma factor [Lysobacter sp.]|nr:anti-sigma factor [Lysobacter sp.]